MATLTNINSNARSMNGISVIAADEIYSSNLVVSALTLTDGLFATPAQVIDFSNNTPIMSGAGIKANTIPDTALSSNVALKNGANTFTNNNSFTNTTYFAGSPDAIIVQKTSTGGYIFLNNNGTIGYYNGATFNWNIDYTGNIYTEGGLDLTLATLPITFGTNAPIMSGANIGTGTIPDTALSYNIALQNGGNTFSGINFFTNENYFQNTTTFSGDINSYGSNIFTGNNRFQALYDEGNIYSANKTLKIASSGYGTTSATTGFSNIIMGLYNNLNNPSCSSHYMISIGNNVLPNITRGNLSMCIGNYICNNALLTKSEANIGIGTTLFINLRDAAGGYTNGNTCNVGIGIGCGSAFQYGSYNYAFGSSSMATSPGGGAITEVNNSIGFGRFATANLSGTIDNNIGIGSFALNGSGNNSAGYDNVHYLSGSNNTCVGGFAGYNICGASSNNTCIGYNSRTSNLNTTFQNSTAIGANSVIDASNRIILGTTNEPTYCIGGLNVPAGKTINFNGIAPSMSGANISSASIPDTALSSSIVKLNTANVFTNTNTFNMATTYRDGATSSIRPTYQNPLWFVYPKVGYSINRRYYYRPQGSSTSSDVITFDVDTLVKYYMMGGGGGGAGNVSTNILGGGGGGAGQLLVGSFTALAGITYTLTTDAHTGTGSNGNATSVLAGTTGGSVSITGTGLSLVAAGGIGGSAHTSTAPAGRGGNSGSGALGGNGATTTGTAGLAGASQGGGAGGSFNFATSALGNTFTLTMTDFTILTFKGGDGGGNNATSGLDGTLYGNGGSGGGGTGTQNGENGVQGFILLEVVPYTQETYLFNPTYGITSNVYENSRLIATTEYVKNQYYLNNTFSNLLQVNVPPGVSPTTTTTGVNGAIQVVCTTGTTSVARDGMAFKAGTDTNSIINFANTLGVIRGSISAGAIPLTSVAYNTSSDERLKENIVNMPSQLENIKSLSARAFDWKSTGEHDNGFIAQEIYRVYPNLNPLRNNDKYKDKLYPVKSDGTDFIHLIDYGKMTPYLWSAVQELTLVVEKQQKQIDELVGYIKSL